MRIKSGLLHIVTHGDKLYVLIILNEYLFVLYFHTKIIGNLDLQML